MSVFRPALFVVGLISLMLSFLMTLPVIGLVRGEHPDWRAFLISAAITGVIGAGLTLGCRNGFGRLRPRQLFMITLLSWLATALLSSLPLLLGDFGLSVTDAVFESVSGVTTTGSTVLTGLDNLPSDLLLWRSLLQWLGGIGIIGMAVAILPFLQVGGMRLFQTESSDWSEKAMPRARELAKSLVFVYLALSVLCVAAYRLTGMSVFEAVNHGMTTISTGGYSTSDASLGHFPSPAVHWVGIVFMVLGGLPFVLYVRAWTRLDGSLILRDAQARGFLLFLGGVSLMLAAYLALGRGASSGEALTLAVFNVVSIVTTTGYASADYASWGPVAVAIFFLLTFVGGCSGSTSGGMKIFRFQLSWMLLQEQIRKLLHPRGVFARRYNGRIVGDDIIASAVAFSFIFFISLGVLTLLLAMQGLDLVTALSGAATALCNVGPGLGTVIGPAGNFQTLPDAAKWLLCGGMILGRLELLSVVIIFTSDFWRD